MKITELRSVVVDGGFRNWIFVVLETDAGLRGYGECTLEGRELAVVGALADFRRHVVGEPAEQIRRLVRRLSRHGYWESGPVISSAIAGIEIAQWDLYGKQVGQPLHALLGGSLRDEIETYSNAWYFGATTPQEFAEAARRTVELGFRGLKFDPFETADLHLDEAALGRSLERVEAVREAVGPGTALMIEGHGRFNVESALRVARRLGRFDVAFFEEPTPPGDLTALAQVARSCEIPIAAGERAYDLRACQQLIAAGVAVLQADVVHVGGISCALAAAELCDASSVAFAPHNASGPIATAATLQVSAVAPALLVQEMFAPIDAEWKGRVVTPAVEIHDGRVRPHGGPGLGIELDHAEVARHPYAVRDLELFGSGSILSRPAAAAPSS